MAERDELTQLRKQVRRLEMDKEILKKGGGLLREGERVKFASIAAASIPPADALGCPWRRDVRTGPQPVSVARYTPFAAAVLTLWPCGGLIGCGDPVPDANVSALGSEDPNVPPGPMHRPGQPCVDCHQAGGKAQPFSVAGTVYADVDASAPVGNANVYILDSANVTYTVQTNCSGNFYVRPEDYSPKYPYWASLRAGGVQRDMNSPSYREGSCAACHAIPVGPTSPGPVFVIDDPTTETLPPSGCN